MAANGARRSPASARRPSGAAPSRARGRGRPSPWNLRSLLQRTISRSATSTPTASDAAGPSIRGTWEMARHGFEPGDLSDRSLQRRPRRPRCPHPQTPWKYWTMHPVPSWYYRRFRGMEGVVLQVRVRPPTRHRYRRSPRRGWRRQAFSKALLAVLGSGCGSSGGGVAGM